MASLRQLPMREFSHDSLFVQPVTYSLYYLSYPGSTIDNEHYRVILWYFCVTPCSLVDIRVSAELASSSFMVLYLS